MPRKVIRGAGMTTREETVYEVGIDEREISEMFDRMRRSIEERGLFGMVSTEAETTCRSVLAESEDERKPDNPHELARPILKLIEATRNAIEKGEADCAARLAFSAGMRWGQAWMKWAWEPDALRGEKVGGGEKNSAHKTNARHEASRNARFAIMEKRVPLVGVNNAAAECAAALGCTPDAVKRQWNRAEEKKKRDT